MKGYLKKGENQMPIIYREHKGAPLTIQEMDGNFKALEERLEALEKAPLMAEGIKNIHQEGDQLKIESTEGRLFGPFQLPKYLPNPKGVWTSGEKYTWGDWVSHDKSLYFCIKGHASEVFAKENWQELLVMKTAG